MNVYPNYTRVMSTPLAKILWVVTNVGAKPDFLVMGSSVQVSKMFQRRVCLCVCLCHNEKKCQTNGKHDVRHRRYFKYAAAITTQRKLQQEKEAHFISQSLPSLQKKKEKRSSLLNLHMLQSTCFRTSIETGVDSKDDSGSQGQYSEERREVRGKMMLTSNTPK